jgi:RNA polymerase sigma-70 factor (ECF subfamily)
VIGAAFGARVAEAQGGSEEAFVCLFRDIQPALLRYLRVIAPGGAEGVAGETWRQVVAGLAGFSGGESAFRVWVFTIARHLAMDWGRSQACRRTVPVPGREPVTARTVPGAADVGLGQVSTQSALALLAALPRDQAELIMLHVAAGLDAWDVARVVGKTPDAVRVAAHGALRGLADVLERAGVTR